ncbi:MAG: c-type cytochrome [Rhodanobacteraceae bacterium]
MERTHRKKGVGRIGIVTIAAAALGLAACHGSGKSAADWATTVLPPKSQPGDAAIQRGRYLARAGDCTSCHTEDGGKPFAGGHPVLSPYGTMYGTNITPDKDTGIGRWSEADFYRAMHAGVDRQGNHLYPAMPYPWFTKVTPGDVRDIKAYLDTLAPVRQVNRQDQLSWPMTDRGVMGVWNKLYFNEGTFKPNPKKSAQWNRGAYLVEGLGHCGACHTAKNLAGAPKGKPLRGGLTIQTSTANLFGFWRAGHVGSFAPSLAGGLRDGLGGWTNAEIVEYLKTGSNDKSSPVDAMEEVVHNSTQHLTEADLDAIATYLKDMPTPKSESTSNMVDRNTMARGEDVYVDDCTGCHMDHGQGEPHVFPPLKGSSAVQAASPDTMVRVVLHGAGIPVTKSKPTGFEMPAFNEKLDDAQIADVVTYIRNAWDNHASTVSAGAVAKVRADLRQKGAEKGSE